MYLVDGDFWREKRVLVTGHTGFKGAWLSLWLEAMGAKVFGFALPPPTSPSLFDLLKLGDSVKSTIGDIRSMESLALYFESTKPDVVFHLAAQPLVLDSYNAPAQTYEINVMGTINVLEAVRQSDSVRSVVIVTSDKCYENNERLWGFREDEPMGGADPYSSSKGCAELVVSSYRQSFFNPDNYHKHGVGLASARAGNVIGGGDWARNRLITDAVKALGRGDVIELRNPNSTRPWQHVLDPLSGYLTLGQFLFDEGARYSGAWNFGPSEFSNHSVADVVESLCSHWGADESSCMSVDAETPHEANSLRLDCTKAAAELGWKSHWSLDDTLASIASWYKAYLAGDDLRAHCIRQIERYGRVVRHEQ